MLLQLWRWVLYVPTAGVLLVSVALPALDDGAYTSTEHDFQMSKRRSQLPVSTSQQLTLGFHQNLYVSRVLILTLDQDPGWGARKR